MSNFKVPFDRFGCQKRIVHKWDNPEDYEFKEPKPFRAKLKISDFQQHNSTFTVDLIDVFNSDFTVRIRDSELHVSPEYVMTGSHLKDLLLRGLIYSENGSSYIEGEFYYKKTGSFIHVHLKIEE